MEKITLFLLKNKWKVVAGFIAAMIISGLMIPLVTINYDLTEYLPDTSMSKKAISALEEEFTYPGLAEVMLSDVSVEEALAAKKEIEQIKGVSNVTWLDDMSDLSTPVEYLDSSIVEPFYKDNSALFTVEFASGNYSVETGDAIDQIRQNPNASVRGMAEDARNQQNSMTNEIFLIIVIVLPICILILLLASNSWIEPVLYLLVIGISILLNMGTNAVFDSVSYLTFSVCAVLQLAISMDYSLFLSHRYIEELDSGKDSLHAIAAAVKGSFSSIFASSFTTFAGFISLLFMGYAIGFDLGIVLAKGILFSFVTVIILMPILLLLFSKVIDKSRHKPFIPKFTKLGAFIVKLRYPIIVMAILITIPAFMGQNKNEFLYGDNSASNGVGVTAEDKALINEKFGISNPIIILTPRDSIENEKALSNQLMSQQYVKSVTSLASVIPEGMPIEILPKEAVEQFYSENYTRYIVSLTIDGENEQSFQAADEIEKLLTQKYNDKWLAAGSIMSIKDIKNTVEDDSLKVELISILAVGLIVLLVFRSLSIPVLLVLVIQASVWINMSFPYFTGTPLVFIGYLIVSSIQLGATIDYGILLTSRYLEYRKDNDKKKAVVLAVEKSGSSVIVSALILSVAGFTLGLISKMSAVADIGLLLGRGAMLSGVMVLLVLPALIIVFDKVIQKTTLKKKGAKQI